MKEEKVVMYDSPEAATYKTNLEGWVSSDGRFFGNNEHSARWSGCTHLICDCGNVVKKTWTKCDVCIEKARRERYLKKEYKDYNGDLTVMWDGETYFPSEDDIIDYMNDEGIAELDLLYCEPVKYRHVDYDYWNDDLPEDGELPKELENAINELNKVIDSLGAACYAPGNIRTTYKLKAEI